MTQLQQKMALPAAMAEKLEDVRRRTLRVRLGTSIIAAAAVLLSAMALSMFVDWLATIYDVRWRAVLTYTAWTAGAVTLGAWLITAWRHTRRIDRMAAKVDHEIPELEERWSTVTDLSTNGKAKQVHPAMFKQVSSEAQSWTPRIEADRVVPLDGLIRALLCLTLITSILGLAVAFDTQRTTVLLKRFWQPYANISATELVDVTNKKVIGRGESYQIEANIVGTPVTQASLLLEPQTGEPKTITLTPRGDNQDQLSHRLRAVKEPMRYRLRAGDGQTEWYDIEVADRPQLSKVWIEITPPAYTRKQPKVIHKLPRRITVLEGSKIDIALKPKQKLQSLRLQLAPNLTEQLSVGQQGWYRWQTTLTENLTFKPLLVEEHGLGNLRPPTCEIKCRPDKPPVVKILTPNSQMAVRPDESIPVTFVASDDVGVYQAELLVYDEGKTAGAEPRLLDRIPVPLGDQQGAVKVKASVQLDLSKYKTSDGSELSFSIRVREDRGQLQMADSSNNSNSNSSPLTQQITDNKESAPQTETQVSEKLAEQSSVSENPPTNPKKSYDVVESKATTNIASGSTTTQNNQSSNNTDENAAEQPDRSVASSKAKNAQPSQTATSENSAALPTPARSSTPARSLTSSSTPNATSSSKNQNLQSAQKPTSKTEAASTPPKTPGPAASAKEETQNSSTNPEENKKNSPQQPSQPKPAENAEQASEKSRTTSTGRQSLNTNPNNTSSTRTANDNTPATSTANPKTSQSSKSGQNNNPANNSNPPSPANSGGNNVAPQSAQRSMNANQNANPNSAARNATARNSNSQNSGTQKSNSQNSAARNSNSSNQSSLNMQNSNPNSNPQSGSQNPGNPMSKRGLDVPQAQSSNSQRMRLKIDEWAGSYDGQQRQKLEIAIAPKLDALDRALGKAESLSRAVLDAVDPDTGKSASWASKHERDIRRADEQTEAAIKIVEGLEEETYDTPYAFIGLQLVDINQAHIGPARRNFWKSLQTDSNARISTVREGWQHTVRARELIKLLTERFERTKIEYKMAESVEKIKKMYRIFVEDSMALLRPPGEGNRYRRKVVEFDLDDEYLKRLQEVMNMRSEMRAELARILADDPRLLRRYLDAQRNRQLVLRNELDRLIERQNELNRESRAWASVEEERRPQLTAILLGRHIESAQDLAIAAADLHDKFETWSPLGKESEDPDFQETAKVLQEIATATRELSADGLRFVEESTRAQKIKAEETEAGSADEDEAAPETPPDLTATVESISSDAQQLYERFNQLELLLRQIGGREDSTDIANFALNRLLETRRLIEQTSSWIRQLKQQQAGNYHRSAEVAQYRLAMQTDTIAGKLANLEQQLANLMQNRDGMLPESIAEKARGVLAALDEQAAPNQLAAVYALRRNQMSRATSRQQAAADALALAGKLYDEMVEESIKELDKLPVQDPIASLLDDPTLDELLRALESEANVQETIGIPNRPSNLRIISDWLRPGGDNALSVGGRNRMLASQMRQQEQMRQRSLDQAYRRAVARALKEAQAEDLVKNLPRLARETADWNRLASQLGEELRQGRDKAPPERYRRAIEQYFRQVSGAEKESP